MKRVPSLARLRPVLARLHRWVGLVMAGFLLVAGLTGSLMAWTDALEAAINPQLFVVAPPATNASMLDPVVLRERLLASRPDVVVPYLPLNVEAGRSMQFSVEPRTDAGAQAELPNDQVFVDPYTGEVLGERRWGDISQGLKNFMPFVYRLHHQLALGVFGNYVFGIVALLWTLDCFVGAYLTFPAPARGVPGQASRAARWWANWKVRWGGGSYKMNFDLHRAGGLWMWAALLVMAWSSVAFNLSEVYDPVMDTVLARQRDETSLPTLDAPLLNPAIDFGQAREIGRRLLAEQARSGSFAVHAEDGLAFDPVRGTYRYDVRSSRDIRDRSGATSVLFDADTGTLKGVWLPTGAAGADTVRTWLTSLHRAALWGAPMKLFVCMLGLAVAALSVTGVVIWRRKQGARSKSMARR
ncbi:PepSY-associated TM helix domain-containing protein [Roseateles sp.]|uniref:PepSY-associated TM helix domain-containing protein n=1 Tax=Roseateles sp. TaxID=1971397 RepID=UPI0039E7BABA